MPTFRNALAEKLIAKHSESRNISGAIRRAASVSANNFAASLERQTNAITGGNKAAQGAVAVTITRRSGGANQYNPTTTTQPAAAQTPSTQSTGANIRGGGLGQTPVGVLYRYTNTKIVGGQVLEITTEVWLLANGDTKTVTKTRVVGQSNRPR